MLNRKLLTSALGIFILYFYFGILQEKVTRGKYQYEIIDENGFKTAVEETFTYALSLVCIMCLANYLFAQLMQLAKPHGEDRTSKLYYGCCALTYLLGMVCSNMALQWVPYPIQVVGKSVKPIPVMLLGVLIGRKSYPLRKYLFIMLICAGAVLFMYKESKDKSSGNVAFGLGEILLLLSLLMDGLTGAIQERIRAEAKPTAQQMMVSINFWSIFYVLAALIITGEGSSFIAFVRRHPRVLSDIALLSVCGALGQLFIYIMVSSFGPLPCAIVTTTRKLFTVLTSVILFGNVLLLRQWIAAGVVFVGLFLDAFYSKSGAAKKTGLSSTAGATNTVNSGAKYNEIINSDKNVNINSSARRKDNE